MQVDKWDIDVGVMLELVLDIPRIPTANPKE